ncbi:uncharacterized protein KRP23_3668 [Phytophthora ramorum]|uniref:uncharacterized protein n=1 Tax=Phytophthora ramorum TaxID=164328 RepID=UPI0030B6C7B6|nr:hypothetical protein KRP23_3668 [Phytophthora ramorum]
MEPKSGKLHKLGSGFFGPKWTEKWVHLDGTLLKCFPMAVEQQVFSLGSSRQSSSFELMDYKFVMADEKKVSRKFAFQLESIEKSSKAVTFACSSEKELTEWRYALTSRLCLPADAHVSPVVTEKIRRAAEAFKEIDPRHTGRIDVGKLRGLLLTIGWEGLESELDLMQQQLDIGHHGVITRTRLLTWLQSYYCAQEVMARVKAERANNQVVAETYIPLQREESASRKSSALVSASKRLLCQGRTDWNHRYYALVFTEPSTDMFDLGTQVSSLLAEFRQAAEILVREIIAEMALDDEEKTLHPQSFDSDEFLATDGIQQYGGLTHMLRKYQRDGLLVYLCVSSTSSASSSHEKRQNAASVAIFHKMLEHSLRWLFKKKLL